MGTLLRRSLITPRAPRTAAGLIDDSFAVVDLTRRAGRFSLQASALTKLPAGLVTPAFDVTNIRDHVELAHLITQTTEAAGLAAKTRWSVALPEGVARTLVITLESKPSSRRELTEILSWKIERFIATPTAELRISRQRLTPAAGNERYMVTVARHEVLSEYEAVFEHAGWQAGLLLPQHLAEAQWLMWAPNGGDKMLVSATGSGFTSVVVSNGEPVLVRAHACDPASIPDELHRFALFYRDRHNAEVGGAASIDRVLVIGEVDAHRMLQAVADALEGSPRSLDPTECGLDLAGEPIRFDQLASAAGLATLAWQ